MIGCKGHYNNANGIAEKNHDIVGCSWNFHDKYTKIKDVFESGENVLVVV